VTARLTIAIPSKGRLMQHAEALFSRAGFAITRSGDERGYRGTVEGEDGIEVAFLSAAEIARALADGSADLGITGEDLLRETMADADERAPALLRLGFGPADVVVAVPTAWLDVATMADLDDVSEAWYAHHGRRLRVATKFTRLTRAFFAARGVTGYRIVESLGATEGAPTAGTAEVIVDITTTGSTLKANHLKILDDGVILKSEAVLAARAGLAANPRIRRLVNRLEQVL